MIKLGKLSLDVPFFQAALSGYSDQAMCSLALEYGAPLVFSGLVLDKSVLYPGVLNSLDDREHPMGGQLLGGDPAIMARAAKSLQEFGYDLIDLNFACPVPKVVHKQRGGFLLTRPDVVTDIVRKVRQVVTCPLTMKLRIGYDNTTESQDNFWRICEKAADAGVDGFVVHGRTVLQRYRQGVDWQMIGRVKQRFDRITVIGSGNVFTAEDVARRLTENTIDGVLIARGAIGNPWIFREARALIAGQPKPPPPSLSEQGQVILRHFEMILGLYQARKAIPYFRKFCIYYCKRHPQRKKAQMAITTAQTVQKMRMAIEQWYGL